MLRLLFVDMWSRHRDMTKKQPHLTQTTAFATLNKLDLSPWRLTSKKTLALTYSSQQTNVSCFAKRKENGHFPRLSSCLGHVAYTTPRLLVALVSEHFKD